MQANVILAVIVIICALALVSSRNSSRELYRQLDVLSKERLKLRINRDRLELELLNWASHERIKKIARNELKMSAPKPSKVWFLAAEYNSAPTHKPSMP